MSDRFEYPTLDWFESLPEGWDPVNNPDDPLIWIDHDTGRMAALVAPHDACLLDGTESQRCVRPPTTKTGYRYAHVGNTRLADGMTIKTANIGGRVNHAGAQASTSMAQDHYANTATRWARVRYFEDDEKNIWAAGALSPGLDILTLIEIEGSALSGDWRWIDQLRNHEMAGSQLVNTPGFRPAYANAQFTLTAGAVPGQWRGAWTAAPASQGIVLVALPMEPAPWPDAHVTLCYFGDLGAPGPTYVVTGAEYNDPMGLDPKPLLQVLSAAAIRCNPFMAEVSGRGILGPQDQPILLLESPELQWMRDQVEMLDVGKYPSWVPHMSMPSTRTRAADYYIFDRVALWAGDQRWEFPLVGDQIIEAAVHVLTRAASLDEVAIDDDPVDSDWLRIIEKERLIRESDLPRDIAIGQIEKGPAGVDPADYLASDIDLSRDAA
jgi:hypothetical protein